MKRRRIKKQLLAAIILGGMLCMLLPAGVWAAETVSYIDENGVEQTAEAEEITSATTTLNEGWYVTDGDLSLGGITVSGEVNLILKDGVTLTVTGEDDHAGVTVEDGDTLTIYGQSEGTGRLEATGGSNGAGIGGGDDGDGGAINITGGTVDAKGGDGGAGIGGGVDGDGGTITISGGTIDAKGGLSAAGIGGGYYGNGDTITISGSAIVTAKGGFRGAGIGGGYRGDGGTVTISGGTVTATSRDAEAVGMGYGGADKTVTIDPPADVPLYVYVGDAAPGARLAGSPFTAGTPYTGTDRYFHLTTNPPSSGSTPPNALIDSGTGIGVSGAFRSGTTMTVGDILMHEPGECPACDAIRAAQQDSDLNHILWMDISLSRDCDGPFTVTIPVGEGYEGQTLTILHCADEGLKTYTAVVRDGKITFTVESLSPFAVYAGGSLDDIPITGDTGSGLIWWLLCGLSAAGMAAMLLVRRKGSASGQ
mgnify:CR=1 FL=1